MHYQVSLHTLTACEDVVELSDTYGRQAPTANACSQNFTLASGLHPSSTAMRVCNALSRTQSLRHMTDLQ